MPVAGSATINAVNSQRHAVPVQDPIGDSTGYQDSSLRNGCIGGGFSVADDAANFALETPGYSADAKAALYVEADVDILAGNTVVTVAAGHITAATGGTYTAPVAIATGQFGWVHLTA